VIAPDTATPVFHESWHRIAAQRVSLRPNLRIHRQMVRCETWYVLHDPFTNQYWRIRPQAYAFIARLGGERTVGQAWDEILRLDPEEAPGQGEVIELLGQLYQANMVRYESAQDGETLFERKRKRDRQKVRQGLVNILFLRIPLFDPDPLLKALLPLSRVLFSTFGGLVWLFVLGLAAREAVGRFDVLRDQAEGVLAPSNLVWLYVSGFLIKIVHEFGHGMAVRRQGGEVHAMGVMFMMLAPLPYTDASASWSFRERWRRILVSCSGVLFELFIASLSLLAWSQLGEGPLRAVCYNMFFVASVTTVLFNINPLMRFDGYYVLSDLLDMPNLQQTATNQIKHLFERHVLRLPSSRPVADSPFQATWLTAFGLASNVYRILLFGGILVAISKQYLIVGLFMGVMVALSWLVVPLWKFATYLVTSPQLRSVRTRAIAVCAAVIAGIVLPCTVIPLPDAFTAAGVLDARQREVVVNGTSGRVVRLAVEPGKRVEPGDLLLVMENPELESRIAEAEASVREAQARFQKDVAEHPEDAMPDSRRIEVVEDDLAKLRHEREGLAVKATVAGTWASLLGRELEGKWIHRGDSLGEVVDPSSFRFLAAVTQDKVERLFAPGSKAATVRLNGATETDIRVSSAKAIPMEHSRLPSAALGWYGGGEFEVDASRGDVSRTLEPFHLVEAQLAKAPDDLPMLHGRTGRIRFVTGRASLAAIGWRRLRQLVQKHYRL